MEKYCKSCGVVFNDLKFKLCPYCASELDTRYGRQPIPRKLRHEVFMRDGYRCRECGASKDETSLEIDHIVPVARGGTNDIDNLQTLCRECNRMKHTDTWVGGETDLDNLKRQLSQLNNLLNDKEEVLNQASTEEEEIIIKYDIIKLNEKIQDVEEKIQREETKIKNNIIKKKEAETNDFTFKWLYASVSEEKLALLCDFLMIKNFDKMELVTNTFIEDKYKSLLEHYDVSNSLFEEYDKKNVYLLYYMFNPFINYCNFFNYFIDFNFEKNGVINTGCEKIVNDFENENYNLFFEQYLNDKFISDFSSFIENTLENKRDLFYPPEEGHSIELLGFNSFSEQKENYVQCISKYFSLKELKQSIEEIDEFLNKFNDLGNLKNIFLYNSENNFKNSKLRLLYWELNIPDYQLPFYKIKYILDNYSNDEIESKLNYINHILEVSENPIKMGVKDENTLKFIFKEFNIDDSFPTYFKFKFLLDNYSKREISGTIKYIEDIFDIIYSEMGNNENSDEYLNNQFDSIKNEILKLHKLSKSLKLNLNADLSYDKVKNDDTINFLLLNYAINMK